MPKSLEEIKYDENVKKFLSQKIILAHILVSTVKEFFCMKPEEVVLLIEEPVVSTAKVDVYGSTMKDFVRSGCRTKSSKNLMSINCTDCWKHFFQLI